MAAQQRCVCLPGAWGAWWGARGSDPAFLCSFQWPRPSGCWLVPWWHGGPWFGSTAPAPPPHEPRGSVHTLYSSPLTSNRLRRRTRCTGSCEPAGHRLSVALVDGGPPSLAAAAANPALGLSHTGHHRPPQDLRTAPSLLRLLLCRHRTRPRHATCFLAGLWAGAGGGACGAGGRRVGLGSRSAHFMAFSLRPGAALAVGGAGGAAVFAFFFCTPAPSPSLWAALARLPLPLPCLLAAAPLLVDAPPPAQGACVRVCAMRVSSARAPCTSPVLHCMHPHALLAPDQLAPCL